jgi:hypothetical protein
MRELSRQEFVPDPAGTRIAVVLETNDRAWRVRVLYTPAGGETQESEWRTTPSLALAREVLEEQCLDVEAAGWVRA